MCPAKSPPHSDVAAVAPQDSLADGKASDVALLKAKAAAVAFTAALSHAAYAAAQSSPPLPAARTAVGAAVARGVSFGPRPSLLEVTPVRSSGRDHSSQRNGAPSSPVDATIEEAGAAEMALEMASRGQAGGAAATEEEEEMSDLLELVSFLDDEHQGEEEGESDDAAEADDEATPQQPRRTVSATNYWLEAASGKGAAGEEGRAPLDYETDVLLMLLSPRSNEGGKASITDVNGPVAGAGKAADRKAAQKTTGAMGKRVVPQQRRPLAQNRPLR
jgi:hypothetical protein